MNEHETTSPAQRGQSSPPEHPVVHGGMWMCVAMMLLFALSLFWR